MRLFTIKGMSCSGCASKVERTVAALDGIDSCSVNLLSGSMTVEGNASSTKIIKAVKDVGFDIRLQSSLDDDGGSDTSYLLKRLFISLGCAYVLFNGIHNVELPCAKLSFRKTNIHCVNSASSCTYRYDY